MPSIINPVQLENQRPGAQDWQLDHPATQREIEGYASATSINRGESIKLFVHTQAEYFTYSVYRMGWYQGQGGRLVVGPFIARGTQQPMPSMDPATGLVDCAWLNPLTLIAHNPDDRDDWPSGVYLVKLIELASQKQSYIIFTVHDDARRADFLVQQSVTTYQAYNNWGGKSLYKWNSTENKRASKLSFNRPYAANPQNPAAAYGLGAGEFLCNVQPNNPEYPISNAGWEVNMLRWLEREGYDVAYCTNLDVHFNPGLLLGYRGFLSVGHDEYWTWEMRNHLEDALENGLNFGFFSANTAYWQIRLDSSPNGQHTGRIIVCHKSATRDPIAAIANARHLTTCKWRDAPVACPEASLLGVMYCADPVDADMVVSDAQHWAYAGTGLKAGDRLAGLLGYEVDCMQAGSPANVQILAESPWQALDCSGRQGQSHMTVHQQRSGGWVFATGSIQWCWGLDDFNAPLLRNSRINPAAQQITRNILARFVAAR